MLIIVTSTHYVPNYVLDTVGKLLIPQTFEFMGIIIIIIIF